MEQAAPSTATTETAAARDWRAQHVLVLGLGASGLAMARWCARQGARVTVVDTREAPPQLAALQRDLPQATFVCSPFDAALVQGSDVRAVFTSPGLSPQQVAPLWQAAQAQGLWCGNELTLFAQALADLRAERAYQPQVLAVSGTNGKTTVTSLTAELVRRTGRSVAVAGNIGPTLLDTLAAALDAPAALPDVWVLELSSFQLHGVNNFEPTVGALLNITQDHLDWHVDMAEYVADKARVLGQRAVAVINRDDPVVAALAQPLTSADKPASARGRQPRQAPRPVCSFGAGLPVRPGDFGLEEVNGMVWLVRAHPEEVSGTRRPASDDSAELHVQRLMPADALRIRGRHNALNALAALALASNAGCALAPMLYGLREYRGEPHRCALVGVLDDVAYVDDSKGTNVGATVAALQGLGAERRLVVILGGEGKGQDFSSLAPAVQRHARAVVLIGRAAPQIAAALEGTGVAVDQAADMDAAVRAAAQRAHAGDGVLLSPACASFDMFDNYEHRARAFVQAVQALAERSGVVLDVGASL